MVLSVYMQYHVCAMTINLTVQSTEQKFCLRPTKKYIRTKQILTDRLSRFLLDWWWNRCWVWTLMKLTMQFAGVQVNYELFHQS